MVSPFMKTDIASWKGIFLLVLSTFNIIVLYYYRCGARYLGSVFRCYFLDVHVDACQNLG